MSAREAVVETHVDPPSHSAAIPACLTEDVVREVHGHATGRGRDEFAGSISEDATPGLPTPALERLVEVGDTVVAVGNEGVALASGGRPVLVVCGVFPFAGDRIRHLAGSQVDLSGTV